MRLLLVSLAFGLSGAATAQSLDANPAANVLQPPVMPDLPVVAGIEGIGAGQTLSRPAAKAGPGVESFQFLAGTGDRVVVTASGPGKLTLTAYTPEGSPMVTAAAPDRAELPFVAPIDGIYYVSVFLADGANPYTVQLQVEEADPATAAMVHAVGYEALTPDGRVGHTTCWMEAGTAFRVQVPGIVNIEERSLGGGQWRQTWPDDPNSPPRFYSVHLEGNEIVKTSAGGQVRHPAFEAHRGAYRGYFCAGARY
jgi:hypothetical protein